jgi:hypothetical protein
MKSVFVFLFVMGCVANLFAQPEIGLSTEPAVKHSFRLFANARFGQGGLYPELGGQYRVKGNHYIRLGLAYGKRAVINEELYYIQNGIYFSPDHEVLYYHPSPPVTTYPKVAGMRETISLEYQTASVFLHYQLLLVGYVTKSHRVFLYAEPGGTANYVTQKLTQNYLYPDGSNPYSYSYDANFMAYTADLMLEGAYEHKSGLGLRIGIRGSYGFPKGETDADESIWGLENTENTNPFRGFWMEYFAGISLRLK